MVSVRLRLRAIINRRRLACLVESPRPGSGTVCTETNWVDATALWEDLR